ncbi:sugar ABC transporter substrate-binding protein [Actinoplanes bogorensis]|uniref:Sugar ABC transporter substrate-binding protein n=1 Tax=Paractinoplanes bogorensis TaxID=1610840 RepID=A0ABS5Z3B7_9ACTN|nr:sugar ABC transporter substrate-binding protein [Actinoplanes bogorensis]MBU2670194.1 sugar ABC transporter substrate-binding protein [Actinoplanes bogorensis]
MRRLRSVFAAVTAVLTVAAAGACAGPTDDTAGAGGKVTLTYWDFIDPSQDNARSKALKENIDAFQVDNPDIAVKLEVVSYGDMLSRLPQASAAGQGPDIVKMYTPNVPQLVDAKVYQPLPDAYKEVTDWLRPIDQLVDGDGKQVAVPYEYRTCSLVYNKKLLAAAGANSAPKTWDEVVQVAGKVAKNGSIGFGTGFSEADNSAIMAELFDCFMSELKVPVEDPAAAFASPGAQEYAQFFADLKAAGGLSKSVVADQYSTVTDGLSNGRVAMAVIGTHRIQSVQKVNPDVDWAPLPAAKNGSNTSATFGWTLGVGSSSKNADAAWKFINYMTGPVAQTRMASGGEVPARAATYDDPFFKTDAAKAVLAIREYVEKDSEPHAYPQNWLKVAGGLSSAGQQLYLKGATADQMVQTAKAAATS